MGGCAVLVRSFARIHETNLKKQGVLPLTFADPADYDRIQPTDRLSLRNLERDLPKGELVLEISDASGAKKGSIRVKHTMNEGQIGWFKAGSALNLIAQQSK